MFDWVPGFSAYLVYQIARWLGFVIMVGTSITSFGQNVLDQVRSMVTAVFDIALPGTDATIGDWLVISGVSYFLTIILAAYAIRLVIVATKASIGFVQSLAP